MSELILKPCPACGGRADLNDSYAYCNDVSCAVAGPAYDRDGIKWNALPRHTDAPIAAPVAERRIVPIGVTSATDGYAEVVYLLVDGVVMYCLNNHTPIWQQLPPIPHPKTAEPPMTRQEEAEDPRR